MGEAPSKVGGDFASLQPLLDLWPGEHLPLTRANARSCLPRVIAQLVGC
jgi:hypothetical protein